MSSPAAGEREGETGQIRRDRYQSESCSHLTRRARAPGRALERFFLINAFRRRRFVRLRGTPNRAVIALAEVIYGVAQESTDERASVIGYGVPAIDGPSLGVLLVSERNEDTLEIAEIAHCQLKRRIWPLLRIGGAGEYCA